MKRLKMKKHAKGMTLVEIVIALFVFVVASFIMVRMGSVASKLLLHSNHVNRKTAVEAPYVANEAITKDAAGHNVNTNMVDKGNVTVKINTGAQDDDGNYVPIEIVGRKYSAEGAVDPTDPLMNNVDYDLAFVDINVAHYGYGDPTETETTASP